ncbi:transcription elongation factor GreA [Patescibacteria group bacterium]|nr:transcription elongation factor GreA [Patescibacteria group bacterium]
MAEVQYISQEGLGKLKEELENRKNVVRKQISEQLASAKDHGDLSENFEYQEAKERQAENEARIAALADTISKAVIVEKKTGESIISVGTSFATEADGGEQKKFQIVGPTESDPMAGKISNESPLGQAFLGKEVGEIAEIDTASGKMRYKIISIE